MPPAEVQKALRTMFSEWGLPRRFRIDNGSPWGSSGDLPPDLALWILGLGVKMHWNRPNQPQENGVVERSQGTAKRWADPAACLSVEALQQELDRMDRIQREAYPAIDGNISRKQAWPTLAHSGRQYTRAWERRHWDLRRVLHHLSGYAVPRRVDKAGRVTLYNRPHYLGSIHRGQFVHVMLDPDECKWVFADDEGRQLGRLAATYLTKLAISNLTVSRKSKRKKRAAKLKCPN